MKPEITISRVHTLPPDLDEELVPASVHEGFEPLQWLCADWEAGANRFSGPGEAFYVARVHGRLAGVCGMNRDPFVDDPTVGRLRRLYVLPEFRRRAVGRRLVERALREATEHFGVVRLRTTDARSAAFFEALGFIRVQGQQSTEDAGIINMVRENGGVR
jgi:N-acetylglutamate synthase-like GNAT family acetyltransferase